MAFIEKKDPVVLNIKLTTKGRELLSTGNLEFKYYAIGDSEIDYQFNKNTGFNPFNANILRPADNSPKIISFIPRNASGSTFNAIPSIPNTTYLVTNSTPAIGFFDSTTGSSFTFTTDSNHVKQPNVYVNMSGVTGGTKLHLRLIQPFNGQEPITGDTVLIKWTFTANTTGFTTQKNKPVAMLVYKIQAKTGTLAADNLWITVDRNLPNYTGLGATGRAGALVYYNFINFSGDTVFNMSSTDYIDQSVIDFFQNSQCPTIIFPFWNLSIIFTDEIAGVTGNNKTFGQFSTNGYAGFVSYIQTQRPLYKKLGVIHYTNDSPANVYAEGFYLNSAKLDMPTIMWHNNSGTTIGASFISASGNGFTLVDLGIHYFDLVDASRPNIKVGKVFDELKIFLIEDQELLYAMSYKSNRSWTLPPFTINGGSGGCPPCPSISDGQTLFVQTIIGTPGSIKNTGGRNIIGYQNVTEYGVEYKLTGATDWTRIIVGSILNADNFTFTITGATSAIGVSKSYNYRSYVKIGRNEYIDHSNDNNSITIPALPTPPPPPPPPIIPTVATIVGTAGIGRIINTGGFNIGCTSPVPQSVFVAVEKYGMLYKLHCDSAWSCSPAVLNAGPLAVDNFSTTIANLNECACYDYAALIQVAGLKYCGACNSVLTCGAPAPVLFVPTVTTGVPFKVLSTSMITKNNYVNDNGGTAILEYGVLYSQNPATPLIYGNAGVGKASIVGDYPDTSLPFTMTLTPLSDSSTVNYRAFAINSAGIGYGDTANTTTPAPPAPPQQALLYVTNSAQLGSNTDVRSCICGKLAVSVPLTAGQTVRLCYTDCAYSQASTPLQRQISACSWISIGTQQNTIVTTLLPIGSTDSRANESYGFIDITCDNIASITLWTVATSHASNAIAQYSNVASVNLSTVVNSGGANYTIGTSSMQAYNTSCCVGGGGGTTGGGTSLIA